MVIDKDKLIDYNKLVIWFKIIIGYTDSWLM